MAKKIYIGNMLQEMQSAIADLQTDMGTMSTDMASMVAELIALKTTIGQGITSLNVSAGTVNSVVLNDTEITLASATITKKITFVCKCDGIIRFNGEVKCSSTQANLFYSVNSGSNVSIISTASTSYVAATKDIIVKSNDVVDILMQSAGPSYTAFLKEGASINYDILDVVNDGAIIVS
jgi:hypothetical protein